MAAVIGIRNAVAYAWFNARGGVRGHLVMGGLVMVGLVMVVGMTVGLNNVASGGIGGAQAMRMWAGWAVALLVIQSVVVALVGGMGVVNAIRADVTSGMHDSMRLMRMSPGAVVMGYVVGASTQGMYVFLPCAVVGAVASGMGGVGAVPWLWASGMLLVSAVGLVVMAAFAGMMVKQAGVLVILGAVVGPMSVGLLQVVPAMALLAGPAAGVGVLDLRRGEIEPALVLSVVAQGVWVWVFFVGAGRKFRRPEGMALGVDLGLVLVGLWAVFSLAGMLMWETVRPSWQTRDGVSETQVIGSLIPGMLVGLVAVTAIGRRAGEWARAARRGVVGERVGFWGPMAAAVLLATGAMWAGVVMWGGKGGDEWIAAGVTVASVGAFYVSVGSVGRWAHSHGRMTKVLVAGAGLLLVVLPVLAEFVWLAMTDGSGGKRPFAFFGQFSPIGVVMNAWWEFGEGEGLVWSTVPGVVGQVLVAGVLGWVGGRGSGKHQGSKHQ